MVTLELNLIFPYSSIRDILAKGQSLQDFRTAVIQIQEIYQPYESGDQTWNLPPELEVYKLKHPPWHCQPYVRPPPEEHLKKLEEIKKRPPPPSSPAQELQGLSKRKMKKLVIFNFDSLHASFVH